MFRRIGSCSACLGIIGLLLAGAVQAQEKLYYRYEDLQGTVVIDDRVPPELVHKGYEVLDSLGRVIKVVPRELTAEERKTLNSSEAQERLAAEERARQVQYDKALLRRYSTIDDIEAARDRKVNEVKVRISILRGNITGMRGQLENHQASAADLEREGRPVSDGLLDNIRVLREEIAESERMIRVREMQMQTLETRFQYDIERFRDLLDLRQPAGKSE